MVLNYEKVVAICIVFFIIENLFTKFDINIGRMSFIPYVVKIIYVFSRLLNKLFVGI